MILPVIAVLLLLVIIYRFIYYHRRFRYVKWFLERYEKYIKSEEKGWLIVEETPHLKSLFKEAGMKSPIISEMEPVGFGYAKPVHAEVFENLSHKRQDFVATALQLIHQLLGFFRTKRSEGLNLAFWIETIVNLPKHLATQMGLKAETAIIKLIQIVYQFLLMLVLAYDLYVAYPVLISWFYELIRAIGRTQLR